MHDVQSLFEQPPHSVDRLTSSAMCGEQVPIVELKRSTSPAARLLALEALVQELVPSGSLSSEQLLEISRRIRFGGDYELADDLEGGLNSVQQDALEYLRTLAK